MRSPARLPALLLAALACCLPAMVEAKAGICDTAARRHSHEPYLAIVSAFPAELAALVDAADIETTIEVDGRQHYVGRLDGVSVVLALTGIGMINARTRTLALLDGFPVAALIMSGVAGSPQRIGDVLLPDDWVERDGVDVFHPNPALLALARRAAARLPAPLEHCTLVPPTAPDPMTVCFGFVPTVIFGGRGVSGDNGKTFPCIPAAGDIFGCELPSPTPAAVTGEVFHPRGTAPDIVDMETGAVARAAAERQIPFLGVRAVSDGAGDPLGDRGFPAQFFDYYRLAARNAAAVTHAVVTEVGKLGRKDSARATCRLLARRRWDRAAARIDRPRRNRGDVAASVRPRRSDLPREP